MKFYSQILILISTGSLGSLACFVCYKTLRIYLNRRKFKNLPGPPTKGITGYFLGNLDQIVDTMKSGKILADLTSDWTKIYGPVFKYQILDKVIVFTIHPDGVKETLITSNFPKIKEVYENVGFPYNERFLGKGLITETNNQHWKSKRSILNHGFHKKMLADCMTEFNNKTDLLMERFRSLADGKTDVTLFNEINRAALDIIASVGFGMNVDSINDPKNDLNHYIYEGVKGFYRITFEPFLKYNPLQWNYILNYKRILNKIRSLGRDQILKRILLMKEGDSLTNDILNTLLKNCYVEDLVDDFVTFFIAGQETTANTLAFCFLEIGRHPRVLKKLREEIDQVIGSRTEINCEDLSKLTYTNYVYKETLRLWPPIPEIARFSKKDMKINDIDIPKNSWIQMSTYVSARNESFFDNPNEFRPERFSNDLNENEKVKNYTYYPFSLGPRNCLGQNFALMLGKIMIAKFVKNFDVVTDSNVNLKVKQEATLRPADGAKCKLLIRNS